MNREDVVDIKFLLVVILTWLIAMTVLTIEGQVSSSDNQHRQICLDHPTYKHCTNGDWF